jgi:hypothetical protein
MVERQTVLDYYAQTVASRLLSLRQLPKNHRPRKRAGKERAPAINRGQCDDDLMTISRKVR